MNRATLSRLLDRTLALPDQVEKYSREDGIRLIRFAITVNPDEPSLYFFLASLYSATNQIPKALFYYEQSLKRGYRDWNKIFTDKPFTPARNTEKFTQITAQYQHPILKGLNIDSGDEPV